MDINPGQIDLNADAVLFDRENETLGFNPSESIVSAGVSGTETLTEPINDELQVQDQKFCQDGDHRGANGSVEPLSGSVVGEFGKNQVCDVMINGSGKEGFDKGTEFVDRANVMGPGTELLDGGCDVKANDFPNGLAKNEDKKSTTERSDGARVIYGGTKTDKGLIIELNDGLENEMKSENAREVTESGSLSVEVELNKRAQGNRSLIECEMEVKNAEGAFSNEGGENVQKCLDEAANQGDGVMMNLRGFVGVENKIEAADYIGSKHGLENCCASGIAESTCRLLDSIPGMEVKDVRVKESLHHKDQISRNHLCEPETSYALKQPAFEFHGQAEGMQNRNIDINITEAGPSENIQNEFHGFNLVVDLNSYRNLQEVDVDRNSATPELNFCVSDLVWGKVRGHPWWPGQIFDPSAASEKAKKHFKKDSYLIAYFGDQTFAWNDSSKIKPFQKYFSHMEKQSNFENFHHAVDCALGEVSRRVEFGLSCPCMPEEVFTKLQTQIITNAGIQKHSSRRHGGDRFLNAISFEPTKLVNIVKSLALSPLTEFDRLAFVMTRAQLLAFYRSKGYSLLPEFIVLDGLFENDMEILLMGEKEQYDDQIDGQGVKTHLAFSHKRKHISADRTRPSRKQKRLSDLMSEKRVCIPNSDHVLERKAGDESISRSSDRKRKAAEDASNECSHKSPHRKLIQLKYVSIGEMWSQLCLAARDPIREGHISGMLSFFSEFRNFISSADSASLEQGMSLEQMHAEENGVRSMEAVVSVTDSRDSYWTDRIIQSIPGDNSLLKNWNEREEFLPIEKGSPLKPQEAAEHEPSELEEHLDESSEKDFCPTALILKFTNLDSVPSETNLNTIFGRFGPLIESQTKLLKKSCRARVVFKRRSDAETAFSSAGKYSIFGPSLVSYRLKIMHSMSKRATICAGKRGRKATSSVDGA